MSGLPPDGIAGMHQEPEAPQPDTRIRFLRVLGIIWIIVVVLTLAGAALAPYLGQIASSDTRNYGGTYSAWTKRGEELYEFGKKPEPPEQAIMTTARVRTANGRASRMRLRFMGVLQRNGFLPKP